MSATATKPRPFRLTRPIVPEDDLHEAVVRNLALRLLPPAEWTCFPAGNILLNGQQTAKLARMGLRRGWPDFLIAFNGSIFGLELKREGGTLSRTRMVRDKRGKLRMLEGQADIHPRLRVAFRGLAVCHTIEAVLNQLEDWNLPMRGVS